MASRHLVRHLPLRHFPPMSSGCHPSRALGNLDKLIRHTWPTHLSLLLSSRREAGSWPVLLISVFLTRWNQMETLTMERIEPLTLGYKVLNPFIELLTTSYCMLVQMYYKNIVPFSIPCKTVSPCFTTPFLNISCLLGRVAWLKWKRTLVTESWQFPMYTPIVD